MTLTEASMDTPVQSSINASEQSPSSSSDSPLDDMSTHLGVTGSMAAPSKAPFRFMNLPPELRNNIYRHYFSELPQLKSTNWSVWPEAGAEFLPILQSSRQVRSEAAPIFYQEHIGNAGDEDETPWILPSNSILDMLKILLAISPLLKEYSPDTEVTIDCDPKAGSDTSAILNAVRELTGAPAVEHDISEGGSFTVGHWDQFYPNLECFVLCGPVGQVDWSSLLGLYDPCMEGSETVNMYAMQ